MARRAAPQLRPVSLLLPVLFRMSHARGKAEAAEGVAQKALEECRLARIAAKELSPSFHIYENGEWAGNTGVAASTALNQLLLLILATCLRICECVVNRA